MKPTILRLHQEQPAQPTTGSSGDSLGRGMEIALTLGVFLVAGWLLDRWLGLFPLFTISLVLFAAVGAFVRLKYTYEAEMDRLQAERAAAQAARGRAV